MTRSSAAEPPEGFAYHADFISADEERLVADAVRRIEFSEVRIHGVAARRRVAHFGWIYAFETHDLVPGPPPPDEIEPLRVRAAALIGREPSALEEVLVTEYTPGATIGWHRDAPAFGASVVGVSLLSACRMRFRRRRDGGWETYAVDLEPRSAYVLGGAARASWQHSIPPAKELRYSITFRTLRKPRGATAGAGQ